MLVLHCCVQFVFFLVADKPRLLVAMYRLLIAVASLVEHRLFAHRLQELWCLGLVALWHVDIPRPGIETVSSTLAGGCLSTVLPGKS